MIAYNRGESIKDAVERAERLERQRSAFADLRAFDEEMEQYEVAPNPVIAIAGVSAFLAILWAGIGYIIGALIGFPS